jgi:hypothetical protein
VTEDNRENRKGWLWGAVTLAIGLIVAFGALANRDDAGSITDAAGEAAEAGADAAGAAADAGADAADADAGADATDAAQDALTNPDVIPAVGSDGAELGCTLAPGTASTELTLDPATASGLASAGIAVAPIKPAEASGSAVVFVVRSSSRVSCDTLSGYIGHRGGLSFEKGQQRVELRRYRVDLASGQVVAFPRSTGTDSVEPFSLAMADATSTEQAGVVASDVPVSLTAGGAEALNSGLGVTTFEEGAAIGTMTFLGERQQ